MLSRVTYVVHDDMSSWGQLVDYTCQESFVGSVFEGTITADREKLLPVIKGEAFITAEIDLILDIRDPFCFGIRK